MSFGIIFGFIYSCVLVIVTSYLVGKSLVTLERIASGVEKHKGLPLAMKNLSFTNWWLLIVVADIANYILFGVKKHYGGLLDDYMSVLIIVVLMLIGSVVTYYTYDYNDVHLKRKLDLVKRDKRRITFIILPAAIVSCWTSIFTIIGFVQQHIV